MIWLHLTMIFTMCSRYFTAAWCKEVSFHPIDDECAICLLSNRVTPSMRLSNPAHQVWVAVQKDTIGHPGGKIYSAYCTCTAGYICKYYDNGEFEINVLIKISDGSSVKEDPMLFLFFNQLSFLFMLTL